jgi:hypothetical protein
LNSSIEVVLVRALKYSKKAFDYILPSKIIVTSRLSK